jgi:hypothetical protein
MRRRQEQIADPATMDRSALIEAILTIECEFPVDFTREYLQTLDTEKLRHVYVALVRHRAASGPQ